MEYGYWEPSVCIGTSIPAICKLCKSNAMWSDENKLALHLPSKKRESVAFYKRQAHEKKKLFLEMERMRDTLQLEKVSPLEKILKRSCDREGKSEKRSGRNWAVMAE